jgi:hypothetical protein
MKKLIIIIFMCSLITATIIEVPTDYPTIQTGINNAVNGDTVLVAEGNYTENINYSGAVITLASQYIFQQDLSIIMETIIQADPESDAAVVTFQTGELSESQLIGFSITGATGSYESQGGGVHISNHSNPTLSHLNIYGNSAQYGAGVYIGSGSSPLITDTKIYENTGAVLNPWVTAGGGGVYCDASTPFFVDVEIFNHEALEAAAGLMGQNNSFVSLENVHIYDNIGSSDCIPCGPGGGGIYMANSELYLIGGSIIGNSTTQFGGAIKLVQSIATISYALFAQNLASDASILFADNDSNVTLDHLTITENEELFCTECNSIIVENSELQMSNSIVWGNYNAGVQNNNSMIDISYTDFFGGMTGIGNINTDPLFVSPLNEDYTLMDESPCIDAGNPGADFDPDNSITDMGAFYYHQEFCSGYVQGDPNQDDLINVLDVVVVVNCILAEDCWEVIMDSCEGWTMDMNEDMDLNVLDLLSMVNIIISTS